MTHPPSLLIIGGPSGAGKTSTAALLSRTYGGIVHHTQQITTRSPRESEKSNGAYEFISDGELDQRIRDRQVLLATDFAKHRYAYDHRLLDALTMCRDNGDLLVVDSIHHIDQWTAFAQRFDVTMTSIFLYAEDMRLLERRIKARQEIGPEELSMRLAHAASCLTQRPAYEYAINTTTFQGFESRLADIMSDVLGGQR